MEKLRTHLTLFLIHHPKYILEPDTDLIKQKSFDFISNRTKEKTETNLSQAEYKELLNSAGWMGQVKLPRHKMKEKILESLKTSVEEMNKVAPSVESYLLNLILNDRNYHWKTSTTDEDYSLLKDPAQFDYKEWTKKKYYLEERIAFNRYLLFLNKNRMIKIKNCDELFGYNYKMEVIENRLEIRYGTRYQPKEKIEEYLGKKQKKLDLENITKTLEIELEKTKNHINWLEEEITNPTFVFSPLNALQKKGIKTRKLIVNTAAGQ